MRHLTIAVAMGLIGLAALPFSGTGAASEDHAGSASRAEGLVLARCSVCHSTDLVVQQRLDRSHWEAVVRKMVRWGAELSEEEAGLLVEFLATRFHANAPAEVALSDAAVAEPLDVDASKPHGVPQQGATVFAHNCQGCHGTGATGGFGPKLAGNPILNADSVFWDTVLHGRGSMPAWEFALSRQDIADLYAWLKTL